MRSTRVLLCAALCAGLAQAKPQELTVWTEVEFDPTGQARSLRFVDEKNYSQGFMDGLRERVMRLRIPAPKLGDQPASLRSGLRLQVEIDSNDQQAQVRLAGMNMMPLVLKRDFAPLPALHADFDKTYQVTCDIDAAGVCQVADIETDGPVEEPSRRWVLATLKLWRFQAPTLNDQPLPSRMQVPLRLLGTPTAEQAPPDFRTKRP